MKIKKLLPLIFLLFLFSAKLSAQGEGNFWFFGNYAGMDFNPGAPAVLTVGALTTSEGCASISNGAGALLFYTDGINVWNKLHVTMPNGTGLLGDPSSTQSGIIVPKPGSSTIYYIFTTAAQGASAGLNYSEVDMSLAGGLGDVTATKNIPLFTPVTEKLTAVKNSNSVDIWVIAHNNNTDEFLVYAVTAAGVTVTPIVCSAGSIDTSTNGIGYMKSSTDGSKIVAAIDFIGKVDVLNFNTTTGIVTLDFSFTPAFTNPYGAEFSPDGTRMYVVSESSSLVYQYNMSLGSTAAILASATVVGTSTSPNLGALQNAPDGKMYLAKWFQPTLGCITDPNALGVACGFIDNAVNLLGKTSTGGLPNFIQTFFSGSSINYVNTCVTDTTFFSLADSITVDSIHWNFDDPTSGIANNSITYAPFHIFSGIGSYNVSVITYLGSIADTSTTLVTITGAPVIFIGNDTSVCAGVSIMLDAGTGGCVWQDGSTNQTFNAATAGTYYVDVTNTCGITTDTIHIAALPTPTVTVNDVSICAGQTANLTAGGAGSYTWSAGATSTGSNTATASPSFTTNYTVTGSTSGCSSTDIATVTVNQLPTPNFTASVTSGCAPVCIQFNETVSTSCTTQSYTFGDGNSSSASSPIHCYQIAGIYSVGISCTDANGCTGSTSFTNLINVFPTPVANFSTNPSGIVTTNSPVTFSDESTGGTNLIWDFDDPASGSDNTSLLSSPSHTYSAEGLYCATLITTNTDGCIDTASECINVVNEIAIPNVFTPNGDNVNDQFYIRNLHLGVAKLTIYNRWGNLIYSSSAYNNDWNGAGASDGVYYYIIDYPPNGKIYNGFVQILNIR